LLNLVFDVGKGAYPRRSPVEHLHNVKAEDRAEYFADRSRRQSERDAFKLLHHLTPRKPAQVSSVARTIRLPVSDFCELRSCPKLLHGLFDAYTRGCFVLMLINVLDDVGGVDELGRPKTILVFLVVVADVPRSGPLRLFLHALHQTLYAILQFHLLADILVAGSSTTAGLAASLCPHRFQPTVYDFSRNAFRIGKRVLTQQHTLEYVLARPIAKLHFGFDRVHPGYLFHVPRSHCTSLFTHRRLVNRLAIYKPCHSGKLANTIMTTNGHGAEIILDLIDGFRRSKTMFAAVCLGIFDTLHERSCTAETLSRELPANGRALERLLDGCTGLGLLIKESGTYRNSPVADTYLRRSSPQTLTGLILYSDRLLYKLWAGLDDAVREGTNRWAAFGGKDALFANFFETEQSKRDFLAAMHGRGLLASASVVASFDLSRFTRIIDLGGGTGHLVLAAVDRYPHMQGAVFDLAEVTAVTRDYTGGRAEIISGDFFADPLPQADLYALGQILHDWTEERIRLLLGKIFDALPSSGGLLISEKLLDEDKSGPLHVLMQSLNMLICTEGRERTLEEYTELLREAGFSGVAGKRTGTPLDAIFATK
jgi:acetylserotonin O-methyltransferase